MKTKFRLEKHTKNVKADASKTLLTFGVDSKDRYTLTTAKSLTDIFSSALCPKSGDIEVALLASGFYAVMSDEGADFSQTYTHVGFYDVIRHYDDKDATYRAVSGRTVTDARDAHGKLLFTLQVVGEFWKSTKNGVKLRGRRYEVVEYDASGDEAWTDTYNVCVDTYGHVALKHYGIGALWTLAKPELDAAALTKAMEVRTRTHMYTSVTYKLVRLGSGNSTQATLK